VLWVLSGIWNLFLTPFNLLLRPPGGNTIHIDPPSGGETSPDNQLIAPDSSGRQMSTSAPPRSFITNRNLCRPSKVRFYRISSGRQISTSAPLRSFITNRNHCRPSKVRFKWAADVHICPSSFIYNQPKSLSTFKGPLLPDIQSEALEYIHPSATSVKPALTGLL